MRTVHHALLAALILAPVVAEAGEVKVITEPSGAIVSQGTLKLGETTEEGLTIDLPAGPVTLLVEKAGFRSVQRTVAAQDAVPVSLTIRLTPLNTGTSRGPAGGQASAAPPATGEGPRKGARSTATSEATAPERGPQAAAPDEAAAPPTVTRPATVLASGAPDRRFSILLSGGIATGRGDFAGTLGFTEFAEDGQLVTDYAGRGGAAFEVGLQYLFSTHLGVAVGGMLATPKDSAHFDGDFPHPLFFDQARGVEGDIDDLDRQETAGFLDFVVAGSSGRLGWRLFGGPAWLKVSADLIESVQYSHAYPYDEVTVIGQTRRQVSDSAFGFSAGAGADYEIASRVALGLQVRYSRATGELALEGQDPLEVDIGGLQAGLAVRLRF